MSNESTNENTNENTEKLGEDIKSSSIDEGVSIESEAVSEAVSEAGEEAAEASVYQIEKQELSELLKTDEKVAPKKKNPLLFAVAGVALAAVASFAAFAMNQTPEKALAKARNATEADFDTFLNNALFTKENNFVELTPQTKMDFTLTVENIVSSAGLPLFALNGGVLSGSINMDEDAKRIDAGINLNLQSEDLLNIHLNLDNTVASFNIAELFEGDYYSVDTETIMDDYSNSLFNMAYLPPDDYAAMMMSAYDITGKLNELNGSFAGNYAKELMKNPKVTALLDDAEKNLVVTKGGAADVGGVKCDTYETVYKAETAKAVLLEYAEFFRTQFFQNMEVLENAFPIYGSIGYLDEESPYDSLISYIESLVIEEDVKAVYYVNGKKAVKSVYTVPVTDESGTYDVTLDLETTGEGNLYNAINVSLTVKSETESTLFSMSANGNHADKSVFATDSVFNVSFNNEETGESGSYAMSGILSYDKAKNRTESELSIESSDAPGEMTLAANWESKTDSAAKTSQTVIDKLYMSAPGFEATLSASFDLAPSTVPTTAASSLNRVEILKLDEMGIMELGAKTSGNLQRLQERVMALFGF